MIEIERFLAEHPPFTGLDRARLQSIARSLQVEFFPTGSTVLTAGGEPSAFLYMVRKGRVELQRGGVAVDVLEPGDLFGFPSLLAAEPPAFDVVVAEDALVYLFEASVATDVFAAPSGVTFLTASLRDRQRLGNELEEAVVPKVKDVVDRRPLVVDGDEPILAVAQKMTAAGVTAAVIAGPGGPGIVTDRDMRARALAGEVSPADPVRAIATESARTIGTEAGTDQALLEMLDLGVHHLPVVDVEGAVVGVLTDLDLLRLDRREVFRLRSEIQRASTVDELASLGGRMAAAAAAAAAGGPRQVSTLMTVLGDALVARLVASSIERLGPPPVPWVWLALGSAGRREQALAPDQDHALVYAGGGHDDYFAALAGSVTDGLARAGIPRCPSGVMASEPGWRGPLDWWLARLEEWRADPDRRAAFFTGIAFDYRPVVGDLDVVEVYREVLAEVKADEPFLRRLARLAVDRRVPVGFLGGLVVHDVDDRSDVLDVKDGGLRPVVELARVFALMGGRNPVGTEARLEAAVAAGTLDHDGGEGLAESYRTLRAIQLRHQVACLRGGIPVDDLVAPDRLGRIERSSLRDSFRLIAEVQAGLRNRMPRVAPR